MFDETATSDNRGFFIMEIWKDIKGYEGLYQVSNLGRVKSLSRWTRGRNYKKRLLKERILNTTKNPKYYPKVTLCKNKNKETFNVHNLVADSFLVKEDDSLFVDHIDNNKLNNNSDNLQFISHRENASKDTFRYGKKSKYVGISLRERTGVYEAKIRFNNKTYYLGRSKDEGLCYSYYVKALSFIENNKNITEEEFKIKVKKWQADNRRI